MVNELNIIRKWHQKELIQCSLRDYLSTSENTRGDVVNQILYLIARWYHFNTNNNKPINTMIKTLIKKENIFITAAKVVGSEH